MQTRPGCRRAGRPRRRRPPSYRPSTTWEGSHEHVDHADRGGQVLRPHPRPRRGGARPRPRHHRPARPQRRRQDHACCGSWPPRWPPTAGPVRVLGEDPATPTGGSPYGAGSATCPRRPASRAASRAFALRRLHGDPQGVDRAVGPARRGTPGDRPGRPHRRRDQAGQRALRWPAPPRRAGPGDARAAGPAGPRRADGRPGPRAARPAARRARSGRGVGDGGDLDPPDRGRRGAVRAGRRARRRPGPVRRHRSPTWSRQAVGPGLDGRRARSGSPARLAHRLWAGPQRR